VHRKKHLVFKLTITIVSICGSTWQLAHMSSQVHYHAKFASVGKTCVIQM